MAWELRLGEGDIDWMPPLGLLGEADSQGWLIVERQTGNNRLSDLAEGVIFLLQLVG